MSAGLYTPQLPSGADSIDIASEVTFIEMMMSELSPNSLTYSEDKVYYEQAIEDLLRQLDTAPTGQSQENSWFPRIGTRLDMEESQRSANATTAGAMLSPSSTHVAYSSASSYMGSPSGLSSPADPAQMSSRKRSVGSMLDDVDISDSSKRPSLSGSPILIPGTPVSPGAPGPVYSNGAGSNQRLVQSRLAFPVRTQPTPNRFNPQFPTTPAPGRPNQQMAGPSTIPGNQFGNNRPQDYPLAIKSEPRNPANINHALPFGNNIIDLTEGADDTDDFPDPFPELDQAYRGSNQQYDPPRPADAFEQDVVSIEDLARYLLGPTPAGGSFALNQNGIFPEAANHPRPGQLPNFPPGGYGPAGPSNAINFDLFGHNYSDSDDNNNPVANPEAIAKLIENIKPEDEVPKELREPTPAAMSKELLEHQKLGLAWLKKMEEGNNKGGILADEMGLGKTVEAIALIAARPSSDPICKTTLVIAPVALMRQWDKEIERFIKPQHQLKTFVYHGSGKNADFSKLRKYDVVLTTFGTLGSELRQIDSRKEAEYVLKEQQNPEFVRPKKHKLALLGSDSKWYRVIIDEAQCIKNKGTQVSRAAAELNAVHRLCMTGTPMMNSINELYPLIRFLRIRPYNDHGRFSYDIVKCIKDANARDRGMKRVQVLLNSIMLRRQKTTIVDGKEICSIPPKHTHLDNVELTDDEHELYKAIETGAQVKLNRYLARGTVNNNYAYILVLLLRLRQACCHPHLIKDLAIQAATEGIDENVLLARAKELKEDVVNRLKAEEEGNSECPICMEAVPNPTIFLPCGHTCCGECFQKVVDPANQVREGNEEGYPKCPHCRGKLSSDAITDYRHFLQVHDPQKAATLFNVDVNSDGSDSDSDFDSDDEDAEDIDNNGDLAGFVVPDDADDDFEPVVHNEAQPVPRIQTKEKIRKKGKGPAKPKQTLAELKKASMKNQAAKRKYLKRLRKGYHSSSKIDKTIDLIKQIKQNDPTEKILIFSQFTSLLDLLEVPLEGEKWMYQRYDGSMKMDDRADAVNSFMDDPEMQIMLISLKAGNAGLNLNKASQVIILDPFWNPYIEDQAVDRAHRMPQNREVHVHRLLVPETVEDRICELQERKREMISAALDEKAHKSISRLSVGDLMYLFGLGRPAQNPNQGQQVVHRPALP